MNFTLSDEQLAIRDTCREFAEQEIKPVAEKLDATG
jgi:short/branched chain acyl-CoA dehydrogenase